MLSLKPKYIDEILSTSQDSYEEVIQALFQLEAKGYIQTDPSELIYTKNVNKGNTICTKIY